MSYRQLSIQIVFMGVGMGGREALAPRIVKMLVKKGYFLSF